MKMKLTNVETLVAVSDAGSIRAAAEKLGKTPSALTKEIRKIEEQTGLALFVRTSHGMLQTEAGRAIVSKARTVYADLSDLEEEVDRQKGANSGIVRVCAGPLAEAKILPRAIARFQRQHPDVNITISSDLFGDAIKALREGLHDIILGPSGELKEEVDVTIEPLLSTEMAVITSASAAHAKASSLRELTDCNWAIMGDTTGAPRERFCRQFTRQGLAPPEIRLATESYSGLLSLVRELDAVCTMSAQLLTELGADSGVVRIPLREKLNPMNIAMITRAGRSLSPAGSHLADCIRHRVGVLARDGGLY